MDSELKKTSMRANTLEKKRFEMMLASFDSAKRNVAVDMKKAQLDFKIRLKRYKDRQREILVTRSEPQSSSVEEFVLKRLRRRSHMSHVNHMQQQQHGLRPQTSPHPLASLSLSSSSDSHGTGTATGTGTGTGTSGSGALVENSLGSTDYEEEEDFAKLSHCRRSKVDLRPCTAWSVVRSSFNKPDAGGVSRSNRNSVRLLQLRGGGLGTPSRQVRYLDDEEIEERCMFYRILLDGYRHIEHQRLEKLNNRVDEFCGKPGNKLPSCPPVEKVGVVSLPAGVPPIVHQAMKVKVHSFTENMQRAKTQ